MKRDVNDGEFHVYVDDELLASNCEFEKHLKKLEKVFLAHRKFGVLVNPKKTNLMIKEVEFLGFQISQEGIFPVKGWAEKVENWPLPSTKKGLRGFLGFVQYYLSFFKNFAEVTPPLNQIPEKSKTGVE